MPTIGSSVPTIPFNVINREQLMGAAELRGVDGLGHFPPAQQLRQAARPLSRAQGFRPDYQVTVYPALSR